MKDKTAPNQMRILLKRMRGESYNPDVKSQEPKKDLNMRDLLGKTRILNEDEEKQSNKKTVYDDPNEREKFMDVFQDIPISVSFIGDDKKDGKGGIVIYDNFVFWGGTIDGVIQFVYKVTRNSATSGVEFNYLDDFSPDNPDNELIIDRVEKYFISFETYWRNQLNKL